MTTVALLNLGCAKNRIDGERILSSFRRSGYRVVDDFNRAEIIVVNTCAFIQEAKEEAIESILSMVSCKEEGRCSTLVVAGCFSQRYRQQITKEFPEVNLWLGTDQWEQEFAGYFKSRVTKSFDRILCAPFSTQYLKISEGCSQMCSFCAIPSIRGPFRSRLAEDCIAEAQWLEHQGVRECILVSQDTTSYGKDRNTSLSRLLEQLLAKTTISWIRLMYLFPGRIDDSLLQLIAGEPRICSYFDIPFQHISDRILKSMKRRPLSKGIHELIDRIRKYVPDATLRSSFILGYPHETARDFKELLSFVETTRFDRVGVFTFSPEEGTPAFGMRPRPGKSTARRRADMLMDIQRDISRQKRAGEQGWVHDVIIDRQATQKGFAWEGRTQGDAPEVDGRVFISQGNYAPGDIVPVQIIGSDDHDLFA
ncbi:MAG: 30S ribosomal protein S12 methylthiotransferase RimO [Chitinivibrionales bacterium]|nr:30S ribosomal protein S12 methylthiotransferase RimO [Chitinivibrionales bacterium]